MTQLARSKAGGRHVLFISALVEVVGCHTDLGRLARRRGDDLSGGDLVNRTADQAVALPKFRADRQTGTRPKAARRKSVAMPRC